MATKFQKVILAFRIIGRLFNVLVRILSGKNKKDEPTEESAKK